MTEEGIASLIEGLAGDIADETEIQAELSGEQRASLLVRVMVGMRTVADAVSRPGDEDAIGNYWERK